MIWMVVADMIKQWMMSIQLLIPKVPSNIDGWRFPLIFDVPSNVSPVLCLLSFLSTSAVNGPFSFTLKDILKSTISFQLAFSVFSAPVECLHNGALHIRLVKLKGDLDILAGTKNGQNFGKKSCWAQFQLWASVDLSLSCKWGHVGYVGPVRWQIKGCLTTEPRTFDSGF